MRVHCLVMAGSLFGAVAAAGQNAATANVTAEVQQPITVTNTGDLTFGNVFPGLDRTVAVADAGAARFTIQGQPNATLNIVFALPATIASGGNTLPIGSWGGRYNTTNSAAAGTDFTPSASATAATLPAGGELFVFVGATAQPTAGQAAGSYAGTMTMTVVYF